MLIVLVAQAVLGSVEFNAVESALVEGLVLQLADVGDESELILAVFGSHVVVDIVSGESSGSLGCGGFGSICSGSLGCGLGSGSFGSCGSSGFTAGSQSKDHAQSKNQCENLFHDFSSIKI